jgi:hypothetical protein
MRIGDLRPPVMLLRRALRVKGFEGWPDLAVAEGPDCFAGPTGRMDSDLLGVNEWQEGQ